MLTLHFKKRPEGGSSLTLERADGTRTWQRQTRHAQFFSAHDFTHYAVETVLELSDAFYGLVARGWDFDSFERPFSRGPIPEEALFVERLVGLLDVDRYQRGSGAAPSSAVELNALLNEKYETPPAPRHITEAQLQTIRGRLNECLQQWNSLPEGETLILHFPSPDHAARRDVTF